MPIDITMPALSPTMTEGSLAKWLKSEGDEIKSGDVIAEIETDKATMEVEAADEGKLGKILVAEGTEGVKVGAVIALLLNDGEELSDTPPKPTAPKAEAAVAAPAKIEAPMPTPAARATPDGGASRIFASPLARRIAADADISLEDVSGTGPHGRIVKADIEAVAASGGKRSPAPTVAAPSAEPTPAAPKPVVVAAAPQAVPTMDKERVLALAGNLPYELIPHTTMRRTIARRLTDSKQTVPHFYLTVDCDIDQLLKVRSELNQRGGDRYKLSVNDFVIRAAALALRKVPAANASWSEDGAIIWGQVDIAVAVAIENGLITPIVKRADAKGLAEISAEMRDLGARAKSGKLKLEEFQGGTFSISNLGMFGIKEFAAVINPPHGAILAVGAGEQRPIVKHGALSVATVMSCTLSVDHRVVDGAIGANFLKEFKTFVEDPLTMLL